MERVRLVITIVVKWNFIKAVLKSCSFYWSFLDSVLVGFGGLTASIGFLHNTKNDGVKICFSPPFTNSSAVLFNIRAVSRDP